MVPNLVRQKPPCKRGKPGLDGLAIVSLLSLADCSVCYRAACLPCLVRVPPCGEGWGPRRVPFSSLVLVLLRRRAAVSPQTPNSSSPTTTRGPGGHQTFPPIGGGTFIPFDHVGVSRDLSSPWTEYLDVQRAIRQGGGMTSPPPAISSSQSNSMLGVLPWDNGRFFPPNAGWSNTHAPAV